MVGGGNVAIDEDFTPLHHVTRAYKSSECRTAIFLTMQDGDPFQTVCWLGKQRNCAVWSIEMDGPRNEQNALDYIDVGVQNGDWVCLTSAEGASNEVMRKIALILTTLTPDPKKYPRRELFRLWLFLDKPIDINDRISPKFPMLLTQTAIIGRAATPPGMVPSSPEKLQVKEPQEPALFEAAERKRAARREVGRDSDSESDHEEPETKLTGLWFHRAVDFHSADQGSKVTQASEEIWGAVERDDGDAVEELCNSGQLDLARLKRNGLSPLQLAVSLEKINSVRALLNAGADVKQVRESDGRPLLFMSLENQDLVRLLIENGCDFYESFEGYRLESHPDTDLDVAVLVKRWKEEGFQ